jgi:hypothetical protein
MPVSLRKSYALEVATIGNAFAGTTHAIRGVWSYCKTNYTACGRSATGKLSRINHVSRNHTVAITCSSCLKAK